MNTENKIECLKCVGIGCNGNCGNDKMVQQEKDYYMQQEELKSKAIEKEERRERQRELGWRKGWHK